jgi:hypothetical protein
MTIAEMHTELQQELQIINAYMLDNFEQEEIDLYLNKMQTVFIKQRSRAVSDPKGLGAEDDLKRLADLQTVIKSSRIYPTTQTTTYAEYTLPGDLLFLESFSASVQTMNRNFYYASSVTPSFQGMALPATTPTATKGYYYMARSDGNYTNFSLTGVTAGQLLYYTGSAWVIWTPSVYNPAVSNVPGRFVQHVLDRRLENNPFAQSNIDSVSGVVRENKLRVETNERFLLKGIDLVYIRIPNTMDITSSPNVDCELPEHTHSEIIDLTVKHILQVTENPRYQQSTIEAREND